MWVNAVTSAMSGVVAFIIFTWVGLDFASLLALTVFVAGFIPNIGAFIGIALPSLVALIQFDSLTPFLIVLFGYGAADQFIANVIQPAMQGKSLTSAHHGHGFADVLGDNLGRHGGISGYPMMVVTMVICSEIPATRWIAVLLSSEGQLQDDQEAVELDEQTNRASVRRSPKSRQQNMEEEVKQLRAEFESRDD